MEISVTKARNYRANPHDQYVMARMSVTFKEAMSTVVDDPETCAKRLMAQADAALEALIAADEQRIADQWRDSDFRASGVMTPQTLKPMATPSQIEAEKRAF